MSPLDLPAFSVAAKLASALDRGNIPYAIGGAIAYGIWGDPRGTHDVDLNLFVGLEELDSALDVLEAAGLEIDRVRAHKAAAEGAELVGHYHGLRVDLFTPSIPFAWEALKSRRRVVGPSGEAAWYLSPEATAIFKLLFFRAKDRVDLEKLVAVQLGGLDFDYVRRWVVDMMGEDDERVVFWDSVVAEQRGIA